MSHTQNQGANHGVGYFYDSAETVEPLPTPLKVIRVLPPPHPQGDCLAGSGRPGSPSPRAFLGLMDTSAGPSLTPGLSKWLAWRRCPSWWWDTTDRVLSLEPPLGGK